MKKNINELIKNICEKQNYDEMLIGLINIGKDSEINNILEELDADNSIDDKKKREIYEKIFEFVSNINEELKENVKKIFEMGVKETIKELRNNEDRIKKIDKIRIIIADDNKTICEFIKKALERYEEIEILGIANTNAEEIEMIEKFGPDIVITDLMRNHKYTGLDIIKEYYKKSKGPEFLVISADRKQDVINNGLEVAGYIQKTYMDYDNIYDELKRIKEEIKNKKNNSSLEFEKWQERYWNDKVMDLTKHLNKKELKTIEKLNIKIKNVICTMQEFNALEYELYLYYEDEDFEPEEQEYKKTLDNTGVSEREYKRLMKKIIKIDNIYYKYYHK